MAAGDLVTAPWHLEWRGQVLGWPLSSATFANVAGWLDLPATRGSNIARPSRHGSYPGRLRAGDRIIEVTLEWWRDDLDSLRTLRASTTLDEDPVEEPLVMWCGTDTPELVNARVIRRSIPTDRDFSVGYRRATIQWAATDPRRYSLAEEVASTGLPGTGDGGVLFPLRFPLVFGTGRPGGGLSLANNGDAATWPIFQIRGPVTGPIIRNTSTGRALVFDPTWTIGPAEVVTIDTDARSVELAGVTRSSRLISREWFPIAADGVTNVRFDSVGAYDPSALLTARWRHASM